jgi:putative component of toxin-antitoxin plasmid stabilization module
VLELRYYLTAGGESPFEGWFDDLDAAAAAKVSVALVLLGQGNTSNTKTVGEGGARIPDRLGAWLPGLFRARRRHPGDPADGRHPKQRQQRDIARAKELWADYKRRRKPPAR